MVAAIGDLHGRDQEAGQRFLTDLQFHIQHLSQTIPEALKADREGLESLHSHLLQWFRAWLDKLSHMTDEEWQQGLRDRSFWKDLYQTLDDS